MTLGNQILMFQERNVKCFYINTPRLTKDQRVSICLEYARVNNAREVIPAALGRSLTTNVYFLTIVRLSTGYCCIRYLIGRFWLILDTFKNGYSSLNAAHSVNIARKCTGRISKSKLDNTECNARSSRVVALLAFKLNARLPYPFHLSGEHLYAHFFDQGHNGMQDVKVKIIVKTNVACPTQREGFWAYKLNSFEPHGLNLKDFV